jgi:hypothetical protein
MSALFEAYVDPAGAFAPADPRALVPNLPAIVEIAKDDAQDGRVANDAVALIRVLGTPACLAPLLAMVGAPHRNPKFKYVVANNALECGGTRAIVEVVEALPDAGAHARTDITRDISGEIARMSPRDQVLAAARTLLADRSTVARWVAIEVLAAMKSTEDAGKIAALATSRDRLVGYWGEAGGNPGPSGEHPKDDPTLGQRAQEVAGELGAK